MKNKGILHPDLARVVTEMGHGDLLCVADAGLPIPQEVERINLAFAPGLPSFLDIARTVCEELLVEACVFARESQGSCPSFVEAVVDMCGDVAVEWVGHDELKEMTYRARAVVRTGEFTPYANVILRSGVDFAR